MKKINVMIIDDEQSARNEIRRLVAGYPEMEIVAEAKNADEAEQMVEGLHPDLLFLDIQMPGRSGFELLESLTYAPQVIFITAFDQHAVKAFEVSALDYLMKPVREERFAQAVKQFSQKLNAPAEATVFIKERNRYYFVAWKDVFLIESMDNYAKLYFKDQAALIKSSLNQLETRLEDQNFFRANRAQIVNMSFVKQVIATAEDKKQFELTNHQNIEISERQWVKFKKLNMDT